MTITICICDYWHKCEYLQIDTNSNSLQQLEILRNGDKHKNCKEDEANTRRISTALPPASATTKTSDMQSSDGIPKKPTLRRLRHVIDGISAVYLLRELQSLTKFREALCAHASRWGVELLWLQIVPPAKDIIDYKWNRMLSLAVWEKIEVEYLMSWLSTLGGGFSALGEQFAQCAETAGKISLKQMAIGMRLGDPFLQARCMLYYSISLIQTGRLRMAKYIVRKQYKFARIHREADGRLVNMCKGIWLRIQYEYGLRLKRRQQQQQRQTPTIVANNK